MAGAEGHAVGALFLRLLEVPMHFLGFVLMFLGLGMILRAGSRIFN
jgi:hypothetical protein